ncbi:MAG: hypothetical protein JETT_0032 [Candidatus Jettenia ecosi]|uniref:Uncharacterized protein n=1 Tax=Candidatus Jettenia ecosi TaxID=2494326 RepID=A0A533QLC3_9BACT|nr:MAG: hypothetical protein JETT_0032 [Candidatus Jettenia ecosi]
MKTLKLTVLSVVCAYLIPLVSHAGDFDGSKPLLFSIKNVIECSPNGECHPVTVEDVNLPHFLMIDFTKKTISPLVEGKEDRNTLIKRMESIEGKLILQGAEKGREGIRNVIGWTASISEETGKTVVTISGDDVAFVVFGACLPR